METEVRHIAMLLYPQFTALDLFGPHHILAMARGVQVHLVAASTAPVTSDLGVTVTPTATFDNCPQDLEVLFVPGGTQGTLAAMRDPATQAFVRSRGQGARWVTSVCTGSLVLGAAGLLQGRRATSHWSALEILPLLGATPVAERVVRDGNRITGAGVTAGVDFALVLLSELAGEPSARMVQLMSEYDPAPPFDEGAPAKAAPERLQRLRQVLAPFVVEAGAAARVAAAGWDSPGL
jgi:putative intracellular protease/amidase